YEHFVSAADKQMLAIVSGGIAGAICFVGLTMLLYRRLVFARVRATSTIMDIAILVVIWVQLCLGLLSLPFSLHHRDGSVMLRLSEWAQRIVTFRGGAADQLVGVDGVFLTHIALGMTLFLLFPFSRLVHIWSAPVWYPLRRYQVVRGRGNGRSLAGGRR
ncbi:MAG: respiratory nitrate reductase subunit gamma, partial [Reyranellales bacterium]